LIEIKWLFVGVWEVFFYWGIKIMRATFRRGPLNTVRGSGKHCKLPQHHNRIWCILAFWCQQF